MSSAVKLKSSDVDVVATISAAVAAAVSACLVFLVFDRVELSGDCNKRWCFA